MFSKMMLLSGLVAFAASATVSDEWQLFKKTYNKAYNKAEEAHRFAVFQTNFDIAKDLTAKSNGDAEFGVTKFSDLTKEEFSARYLKYEASTDDSVPDYDASQLSDKVPNKQDWYLNLTTKVKDQGQCGSCWAFSATEQIETMAIKAGVTKTDQELSVQQIVSCDKNKDQGCQGGDTVTAYAYVMRAKGLEPNSDFPYFSGTDGMTGWCLNRDKKAKLADISSFSKVGARKEPVMQKYIANEAPLSICVDASSWQTYKKGVVGPATCGKQLDHCVQLTGYDFTMVRFPGKKAWLVRNSWNTNWGMKGFIAVEYGVDACGISTEPTTVVIKTNHTEF